MTDAAAPEPPVDEEYDEFVIDLDGDDMLVILGALGTTIVTAARDLDKPEIQDIAAQVIMTVHLLVGRLAPLAAAMNEDSAAALETVATVANAAEMVAAKLALTFVSTPDDLL